MDALVRCRRLSFGHVLVPHRKETRTHVYVENIDESFVLTCNSLVRLLHFPVRRSDDHPRLPEARKTGFHGGRRYAHEARVVWDVRLGRQARLLGSLRAHWVDLR